MPCRDVTEVIKVIIDDQDCLRSYSFSKQTCGEGVGDQALLIGELKGRSVADVLAYDARTFLAQYPVGGEVEEFLRLKHLFAIQAVLEVLTGRQPGGTGDLCAAAEIAHEGDEIAIEGRIAVDLVTEKIRACGHCGTCGRRREEEAPFP